MAEGRAVSPGALLTGLLWCYCSPAELPQAWPGDFGVGSCLVCGATQQRTLYCCSGCRTVICHRCAGRRATGAPEYFLCQTCAFQDLGPLAPTAISAWARLLQGADELASTALRPATLDKHDSTLTAFLTFCHHHGILQALPATPTLLRGYISHCVRDLHMEPATVVGRLRGVAHWHARQATNFPHLRPHNPCRDPSILALMTHITKNHQTVHHSRLPITIPEFAGIYASGFDLDHAAGHHRRLALLISNLGCLRRKATTSLTLLYNVRDGRLHFDPRSPVTIEYCPTLRCEYIRLRIYTDKNVSTNQEVYTYIPSTMRSFPHLRPVDILRDYIITFRPPSGGYLLAAPRTRGVGPARFHDGLYTNLSVAYKAAYVRAYPLGRSVDSSRVASHSGRKSLATWL